MPDPDRPPMSGEFARIDRFLKPLAAGAPAALGLADDAALIPPMPGRGTVVTADALVEGRHWLPDDPPDTVARKLLRTNLSDVAAMGAVPFGYVLTLCLPTARADDAWMEAFTRGLAADQATFGVHLLGGDMTATDGPTVLGATCFGTVACGPDGPEGAARLGRGGAGPGDDLWVSGTVGDAALGLLVRTGTLLPDDPTVSAALTARYRVPEPRVRLGPALVGIATACLDVSDGLAGDADHIARTSAVGIEIDAPAVPLSDAAAAMVAEDPDLMTTVLAGGDDYELLFAAPAAARAAVAAAADAAETPAVRIGRVVSGAGTAVRDGQGAEIPLPRAGFAHFA